ncbi:chromosome partitioning protein ParB [Burkholderia cepacia]|uniref:Chromosome partitioning protein ParB n=1 Tax=Burkholderia cepacia TaxID=292 RepID=A0AAX2RMR0_BURCE|nr:ParB N-terminal domain-containing protein [Burkholderia cepacia]TES65666.1 chromosome partitioning protein ParB [Burkholderia cepacia]TET01678.1 chromosome partitioning protein ParB [Burkholderia cepacia]TEU47536.1 chromosome partitioning protein ParB [Burkholderia cepacia]TEU53563.1 chromosome partitioning protein ParB [Burkholderia cepacia]TEV02169.1 chromosome partitioning protein ParB [Burkholderia cepacia]
MSWMKDQALKAKSIQVTPEDQEKAAGAKVSAARTAPGALMQLQATAENQRKEIEQLRAQLENSSRAKRPVSRMHEKEGRRRKLTPEQYAELKANLARYPLANPVVLEARPDGDWDINAGNNRVAIYRELGIDEIDSIVSDIAPEDAERLAFFANLFSPSLSDFEKYWHFRRLHEEADALSQTELAEAVGLTQAHVSKIYAFDGLPEEAKSALSERPERLGAEAALQLARATAEGRGEAVTEAIKRLVADERYTQKEAVRSTQPPKRSATGASQTLVVKVGKRNFCEITARNGVIGVKLKNSTESADDWAKAIQSFMENKLREQATAEQAE